MNNTNAATYDYYTLDQARELLEQQYKHNSLVKANRKVVKQAKQKAILLSYCLQKLQGLTIITLGCITPLFLQGDATVSLIIIPMGLYVAFRKNNQEGEQNEF